MMLDFKGCLGLLLVGAVAAFALYAMVAKVVEWVG